MTFLQWLAKWPAAVVAVVLVAGSTLIYSAFTDKWVRFQDRDGRWVFGFENSDAGGWTVVDHLDAAPGLRTFPKLKATDQGFCFLTTVGVVNRNASNVNAAAAVASDPARGWTIDGNDVAAAGSCVKFNPHASSR